MIFITILLLLIGMIILWVVFVPVYIRVDTESEQYEIRQAGSFILSFHPGNKPAMRMRLFGFYIPIAQRATQPPQQPSKEIKNGKARIKRSARAWLYLVQGIFKSFHLKKLVCKVDFDDVVLNAQLIPLGLLLTHNNIVFNINFRKDYYLLLEIEARVNVLLWTFIRFLTKK